MNSRDPLTGLGGRAALRDALEALLARAPDSGPFPALLMLDLDRFSRVNDGAGHAVGDTVLRRVAQRLRVGAGPDALLMRVSGDGFAILLEDGREVEATAARVLDLVGRPYAVEGHAVAIGASIGIARAPDDARDAAGLIQAADVALHQAQRDGRNRLLRFEASMQARAQLRRGVENDLRAAVAMEQVSLRRGVALDQFELHYQPQIDLETGQVAGCEALLRWRHPERGLVPPDSFIPIAEEIGIIGLLGDWVLRTACRTAVGWAIPGAPPPRVAVNVSPLQLRDGNVLAGRIAEILAQSGLPPERLEVEITESGVIADAGGALPALRRLGVALALDDFGTGFSSLSQLGRHPFNCLKIDRSFVFDLEREPPVSVLARPSADPAWMIRAIAVLGRGLGMRTVAEGVETPRQAALVREAGCSEMQGYLVSRPVPAAALPELFAKLAIPHSETENARVGAAA